MYVFLSILDRFLKPTLLIEPTGFEYTYSIRDIINNRDDILHSLKTVAYDWRILLFGLLFLILYLIMVPLFAIPFVFEFLKTYITCKNAIKLKSEVVFDDGTKVRNLPT